MNLINLSFPQLYGFHLSNLKPFVRPGGSTVKKLRVALKRVSFQPNFEVRQCVFISVTLSFFFQFAVFIGSEALE